MKHISVIIFLICLNLTGNAQQEFRTFLNIGTPINESTDWTSSNYNFDFLLSKNISNHSLLGAGSSYLAVNLLQSDTYLTFDRRILSFFGSYTYKINLSEKIKLLPQLRIGYSFISSKLNEFPDEIQKIGGVYIAEEIYLGLKLSKNIDLLSGVGFSTIFSKFKTSPDLIVPQNYIGSNKNTINQIIVKIGCVFKL